MDSIPALHRVAFLGNYLPRQTRMPVVTTLHTILTDPSPTQRRVMDEIASLSDRLVTMTQKGVSLLKEVYGLPEEKIDLIPHGIPDMPFVDPNYYKDKFGVEGKTVLLTFGLLSPGKGIEHVISAMPEILAKHPNVVYVVLGATHPHVLKHEGEAYRERLKTMARDLGVADAVRFFNQFVSLEDLKEFIGAADIYITPYLNAAQAKRSFPRRTGTRKNSSPTTAARSCPSAIPGPSRRRWTTCSPTRRTATRCARAPTFSPATWCGRRRRRNTWRASLARALTAPRSRVKRSRYANWRSSPTSCRRSSSGTCTR